MDSGAGNVIIKPLSGQLTHDTDTWGKMDPYCKVKLGAQTEKSKTCTDGGKFPSWTDSMSFRRDKEDLINVEVWDCDVGKDDLIGQGAVALSTVFNGGNKYNGWVDLSYKGKSAGKVLIDVQYFPDKTKSTTSTTSTVYQIPTMGMMQQMQPTMMQQIPTTSIYTQPTVYQQPIYQQPTVYQQPIYQQQQPIYQQQQPIYQQQTQQQQVYQQPIYQQPTQQQQVYQQPTQQIYQQPTQQQQVYQQPTTQQVYQQPTQQQQVYQQPIYQQPTQQQFGGGYPQQKF